MSAVLIDGATDAVRLVWVWDVDEVMVGNVWDLAGHIEGCDLASMSCPGVIYAPTVDGTLTPVTYAVTTTDYDVDDWAVATVTVTLSEGVTATATWKVDGRA